MEGMFTGKMFLVLPVANRQTLGPGQRETIKKCHLVLGGFSEAQSLLLNATQKTKYKRHGHITLMPECSLHVQGNDGVIFLF